MIIASQTENSRAILSSLWTCLVLNALLLNSNELIRLGVLSELMGGSVTGILLSEGYLFFIGLILKLQVAMVLLNSMLNARFQLWANTLMVSLSVLALVIQIRQDLVTPVYIIVHFAILASIVWYSSLQKLIDKFIYILTPPIS